MKLFKKISIILFIFCQVIFIYDSINKITFANIIDSTLTIEQARQLLLQYNNKVDYIYQGSSSEFPVLKSKKLEGYVFLPNVDTDIGYFVDKYTSKIYYFHPSGYLELIKFPYVYKSLNISHLLNL
ncbi:hypothetical protein CHF27_002695 [Romboutsia maritimum]|uniref:Uncharacterized protein n=1 Tax=Romboutsia maritimum TaxID=2020948 RepID=A0A371IVS7_9FIRM|nr:hypothetical protein [Romboutsia maritimum]RDY24568.1 hypothetical protein CHF27_002695 [Romboutsia maritimum]